MARNRAISRLCQKSRKLRFDKQRKKPGQLHGLLLVSVHETFIAHADHSFNREPILKHETPFVKNKTMIANHNMDLRLNTKRIQP
jgi:hypothetical protein